MLGPRALVIAAAAGTAVAQLSTTIYGADDARIQWSDGWLLSDDLTALGHATAFANASGLRMDVQVPANSAWRTGERD